MARLLYQGKLITSVKGYQNYPVEVYENKHFRWISFGSHYIQTVIDKRAPHKPVLGYLKAFCLFAQTYPGKTLLLGIGGGALLHYLESLCNDTRCQIDAVEIDEAVIEVAKHYFMLSKLTRSQIINADASDYIKSCPDQYRHILIDLYQCLDYPKQCASREFFKTCFDKLADKGILSLNIVEYNQQKAMIDLIKELFCQQVIMIPVKNRSNIVIHASKDESMLSHINKLTKNQLLKKTHWQQGYGLIGFLPSR